MLTHAQVWGAIDRLAAHHGLSASGLARRAGLDSTAFNRSKRITADGRARWPSTESIAKVLSATHTPIDDFFALLDPHRGLASPHPAGARAPEGFAEEAGAGPGWVRTIPHLLFDAAAQDDSFDALGRPATARWDAIVFPDVDDSDTYALEVVGDRFRPIYRNGDLLVVSPAAETRRGDRVLVKVRNGDLIAAELVRRTAHSAEIRSLDAAEAEMKLRAADIAWAARIVWVSQ